MRVWPRAEVPGDTSIFPRHRQRLELWDWKQQLLFTPNHQLDDWQREGEGGGRGWRGCK